MGVKTFIENEIIKPLQFSESFCFRVCNVSGVVPDPKNIAKS